MNNYSFMNYKKMNKELQSIKIFFTMREYQRQNNITNMCVLQILNIIMIIYITLNRLK